MLKPLSVVYDSSIIVTKQIDDLPETTRSKQDKLLRKIGVKHPQDFHSLVAKQLYLSEDNESPSSGELVAKKVLIKGKVTSVGFRYNVRIFMTEYPAISGYVRNVHGSVEVFIQGSQEDVERCIAELKEEIYHITSNITSVEVSPSQYDPGITNFQVMQGKKGMDALVPHAYEKHSPEHFAWMRKKEKLLRQWKELRKTDPSEENEDFRTWIQKNHPELGPYPAK